MTEDEKTARAMMQEAGFTDYDLKFSPTAPTGLEWKCRVSGGPKNFAASAEDCVRRFLAGNPVPQVRKS